MAHFSKDIYDRKREYAYTKSEEGLENIAVELLMESPEYRSADLDNEETNKKFHSDVENLIQKLEPVAELSHKRHEIHSDNSDSHLNWWDSEIENIIEEVNILSRLYNLSVYEVPTINIDRGIDIDWDESLICDCLGLDEEEYLDGGSFRAEKIDEVYNLICENNRSLKDEWSNAVRKWFKNLNENFDTEFPQ